MSTEIVKIEKFNYRDFIKYLDWKELRDRQIHEDMLNTLGYQCLWYATMKNWIAWINRGKACKDSGIAFVLLSVWQRCKLLSRVGTMDETSVLFYNSETKNVDTIVLQVVSNFVFRICWKGFCFSFLRLLRSSHDWFSGRG